MGRPTLFHRQRGRRRELAILASLVNTAKPTNQSAGLLATVLERSSPATKSQSAARTPGLNWEGCPSAHRAGGRMSRRRHPARSRDGRRHVAENSAMLRDRAAPASVATSMPTLDGYVPRSWPGRCRSAH